MPELIYESSPRARKGHECNASLFLSDCLSDVFYLMTWSEKKSVVRAKQNRWRIVKGQTYKKQCCKDGGEIFTVRAIPEIHDLCIKYDCYPED